MKKTGFDLISEKENIRTIAYSIDHHVKKETRSYIGNRAIGRAHCDYCLNNAPTSQNVFWIVNSPVDPSVRLTLKEDGQPIYKNSLMGGILIANESGKHSYKAPGGIMNVEIHNRSYYSIYGENVIDLRIVMNRGVDVYLYNRLTDLIKELQRELRKSEEALRKNEEEKKRLKELARKEQEEAERKRIEEEIRLKEEEQAAIDAEREKLNAQIDAKIKQRNDVRTFRRNSVRQRYQPILDAYQEEAKRSHLYDGVSLVIDGGPGTGKTTTMIQRLKYLISPVALKELRDVGKLENLTLSQINQLTDPNSVSTHWLFFSPTDLLLQYLRDSMAKEDLPAGSNNTTTLGTFRYLCMQNYKLYDASKKSSFIELKGSKSKLRLIEDLQGLIKAFEAFVIQSILDNFEQCKGIRLNDAILSNDASRILSYYEDNKKISNLTSLAIFLNNLYEKENESIKEWSRSLRDNVEEASVRIKMQVLDDEDVVEHIKELFESWDGKNKDTDVERINEDTDDVVEEEQEDIFISEEDFETRLYNELKKIVARLGLQKATSKTKFSKREQQLFELVKDFISDDIDLEEIGQLSLFNKHFAKVCKGTDSVLLSNITGFYRKFRKTQIKETVVYTPNLLKFLVEKDNNKHLHPEEESLLLGFINELLNSVYRSSPKLFNSLRHLYVEQYREVVRPVIGIDEATDYSLVDYFFMRSIRYYEYSSITLCGDIMQGLNSNGINQWEELNKIFSSIDVKPLEVSYRQLPSLLNMARNMYHDDLGVYPAYHSNYELRDSDPNPQVLISNDAEEKVEWMVEKMLGIYKEYDEWPSIAVFVGEDVNITKMIERFEDCPIDLPGIKVVDCSGDRRLQDSQMIRIFRLTEVKGMEFEAAFFYDIDEAISEHDTALMRRHLYVGISRATSHMYATMKYDNKSISKYFERV